MLIKCAFLMVNAFIYASAIDIGELYLQYQFELPGTIPEVLEKEGETTLVDFAKKTNLAQTLATAELTVFGPTNAAFKAIPAGFMKYLERNVSALREVLEFHVVKGQVFAKDLRNEMLLPTVRPGKFIRINKYKNDQVITASGRPLILNKVDLKASNGVVHELSGVMFAPVKDVISNLARCPVFKTLTTLVREAGLMPTLTGPGAFTLLAPSDKAFRKLSPSIIDALTKNKTKLAYVLEYHVLNGTYYKAGLETAAVPTLNKKDVYVTVSKDGIKVNDAKVNPRGSDISAENGVIHTIDSVLIPPNLNLEEEMTPVRQGYSLLEFIKLK